VTYHACDEYFRRRRQHRCLPRSLPASSVLPAWGEPSRVPAVPYGKTGKGLKFLAAAGGCGRQTSDSVSTRRHTLVLFCCSQISRSHPSYIERSHR
jgi:hypothetical protein